MEELIKIEEKEGKRLVSARELHEKLKVQQDFSDWIKKQLENVDAVENTDFTRFPFKKEGNNATLIEYALTTDIAKEICMVVGIAPRTNEETRTLSKQFRRYFIECERQLQQVKQEISLKDQLALKVFHGGIDAIEAHKQLIEMETKPLLEKIHVKNIIMKDASVYMKVKLRQLKMKQRQKDILIVKNVLISQNIKNKIKINN